MGTYVRGKRDTVGDGLDRCYALFPVLKKRLTSLRASFGLTRAAKKGVPSRRRRAVVSSFDSDRS